MTPKGIVVVAAAALLIGWLGACQNGLAQGPCLGWHSDCDGCGVCDNLPCCCPFCSHAVMKPLCRAQYYNWNRNYAHFQYGQPIALVTPPTATMQSNWGWGVSSSRLSRLDHQFGRNYPGSGGPFGAPFKNTPAWPQDTNQFGVYYVRGPW